MNRAELQQRAQIWGATPEEIDAAREEDEPWDAMVTLILKARKHALEEFKGMRPSELRKLARNWGVAEELIAAAEDSSTPRDATIMMILGPRAEARRELTEMKPSELRHRAEYLGVSAEEIYAAEDAADPRDAMIALLWVRQHPEGFVPQRLEVRPWHAPLAPYALRVSTRAFPTEAGQGQA